MRQLLSEIAKMRGEKMLTKVLSTKISAANEAHPHPNTSTVTETNKPGSETFIFLCKVGKPLHCGVFVAFFFTFGNVRLEVESSELVHALFGLRGFRRLFHGFGILEHRQEQTS